MFEPVLVTEHLLSSYLGRDIAEICSNSFANRRENHCAHFVSHVLDLQFGKTCRELVSRNNRFAPGANVRVQEIFARCPAVEALDHCPTRGSALIFVSEERNFQGAPMVLRNVPKKHIGILLNGNVWHYSNTRDKVVQQSVAEFFYHYPQQRNALWLGTLPPTSQPTPFQGLACRAG
ncbi:MAG: hypothetical protein AB7N71_09030 [Phycisphaerae bacterium]